MRTTQMEPAGLSRRLGTAARWIRARLHPRRLWRPLLVASGVGLLAVSLEAGFRARLPSPEDRVPTALYARPAAWGMGAERDEPVLIGTVRGDLSEYRVPVRLESVPEHLVQAVLAVEDQRFFEHHGLDLRRIGGAAVANLKHGRIVQGGSTVTQQLAKNLFLSARRTPLRKLREAAMAAALEERYDKATILTAYLNEIYLGQDRRSAIHGVGAAARYYFGRDVDEISLGEAALLAGMIRAPNRYSPVRHPKAARARRDLVLGLMAEQGRVAMAAAKRAARERIRSRAYPQPVLDAAYFRDFAAARLASESGRLNARGVAVYTTLDAALQRAAERAVRQGLASVRATDAQAALVALDPRSGEVLALVGGRDYRASQFNRATDARRQPGSAFKPIVALAALGRAGGKAPGYTLASVISDEPLRVATPAGLWEPANYDREFRGPVTFREALELSLNVPFARIGLDIGPKRIVTVAKTLGITSPLRPVASLALGTSEVTPLELTRAYGVLATGGQLAALRTLLGIREPTGAWRAGAEPQREQVVDPAEAYLVTSALEGVISRGTGRALSGRFGWGGLAGKSGTTNDWRDAWFVAYTPSLVVGVWVGHDGGRSLRLTGAGAALPIVARFLEQALEIEEPQPFTIPDGVEVATVGGEESGWLGWRCSGRREVFLEGTAPQSECRSLDLAERWDRDAEERAEELAARLEERADELVRLLTERARHLLRER